MHARGAWGDAAAQHVATDELFLSLQLVGLVAAAGGAERDDVSMAVCKRKRRHRMWCRTWHWSATATRWHRCRQLSHMWRRWKLRRTGSGGAPCPAIAMRIGVLSRPAGSGQQEPRTSLVEHLFAVRSHTRTAPFASPKMSSPWLGCRTTELTGHPASIIMDDLGELVVVGHPPRVGWQTGAVIHKRPSASHAPQVPDLERFVLRCTVNKLAILLEPDAGHIPLVFFQLQQLRRETMSSGSMRGAGPETAHTGLEELELTSKIRMDGFPAAAASALSVEISIAFTCCACAGRITKLLARRVDKRTHRTRKLNGTVACTA